MTQEIEGILVEKSDASMRNNPVMTVQVAQQFFKDYGDDTEGIYEEIYKTVAGKDGAELANDNYLDALQLTALMIRKTKTSFSMLTGCTGEAFIGHLNGYFSKMVEGLHAVGGFARLIILNPEGRSTLFDDLSRLYGNTLRVVYATTTNELSVSHFVVADDMVRIEKPHPQLKPDTLASVIQARVLFNNRGAASIYNPRFDSLFAQLIKE
jgi:hypothetical protein